jgi:hypothetical protein
MTDYEFNQWFVGFTDGSPKALVIWGTNLTSLVGCGRLTKQVSEMIKLPNYQKSIIIGLLLSDGWLTIATKTSKNARLGFKQSIANSNYLYFVFNKLSHYCSSYPSLVSGIRAGKRNYGLQFLTRSLPCFTELYLNFYKNGIKIIPYNIYELLTPVALGHVVMGDGYASRHGLVLCTDSYSVSDIVRLINVLIIKYRLECTLRYHTPTQPRVYIRERSMPILRDLLRPYMVKSMLYKLD